jgi:hypothetical protein
MDILTSPRCTATNRAGVQCGRAPIPGGNVCASHGGKAPQVIAAAKVRLLTLTGYALDHLDHLFQPRPACPTCGRTDADRDPVVLRACQLVLDRAGLGPHMTVEVEKAPVEDFSAESIEWLTPEELAEVRRLVGLCEEAKRRMEAGEPKPFQPGPEPYIALLEQSAIVDGICIEADASGEVPEC